MSKHQVFLQTKKLATECEMQLQPCSFVIPDYQDVTHQLFQQNLQVNKTTKCLNQLHLNI